MDYAGIALLITALAGLVKVMSDVSELYKMVDGQRTALLQEIADLKKLVTTSRATAAPVPNKIVPEKVSGTESNLG